MPMVNLEGVEPAIVTKADSASILELINTIQPDIPWTNEHLQWQYFETPAGQARLYGIKTPQGRLVALYAAIVQKVRVGKQLVTGRMVQDVMTHADYRGRGFLHYLANLCLHDIRKSGEVGYTFPNEKSEKSFRRNHWDELCMVPLRKKLLDPSAQGQAKPVLDVTSVEGDFSTAVSTIWDSSGLTIGVQRDASYLNWRYRKPATKYFKFLLNSNEGALILKLYRNGKHQTLHICDLFVREDKQTVISGALEFCEQFGKHNGSNLLTAWLGENHPYAPEFNRFGLKLVAGLSRFIFVFTGQKQSSNLQDQRLWHLSQGDSDVY